MLFRLGLLMVRFRWLVIAAWLVAFLVAGVFAPRVLTELTAGFGNPDTEGQRGLELLAEKLGEGEAGALRRRGGQPGGGGILHR